MKKENKAYKEWEKRQAKEIEFYFSNQGKELQLCLVAQGYKVILFGKMMIWFGSGLTAIKLIKKIEECLNEK